MCRHMGSPLTLHVHVHRGAPGFCMHYIWQLHLPAQYLCQAMLKCATSVESTPICENVISLIRGSGVGRAPERRNPRLMVQPMSSAVTRGPIEVSNDERVHKISSQGFSLQAGQTFQRATCPSCNLEPRNVTPSAISVSVPKAYREFLPAACRHATCLILAGAS